MVVDFFYNPLCCALVIGRKLNENRKPNEKPQEFFPQADMVPYLQSIGEGPVRAAAHPFRGFLKNPFLH